MLQIGALIEILFVPCGESENPSVTIGIASENEAC